MRWPRRGSAASVVGVGLASLAWLAASAWARPLWLPDEGRYVGVAWEMLCSGDWLTPTLDGLPYFHKPPLFYWITAASMGLWGPSTFAARAAPMLAATVTAVALFVFVRYWAGARSARLTLVALAAQPLFFIGGQFANLDMLVAGCIGVTILLAAHAALRFEHGAPHRAPLIAAHAAAALGVLAKGLIGAALPLLVIGAWLLLRRRWRTLWALVSLPGALLFLLLVMPWFIAMQQRHAGFLYYFFVVQHFRRFAGGGFNNVHPLWFYPAALALLCLPWLPWLTRYFDRSRWAALWGEPLRSLMLLWVGLVVLFFSVPQSKPLGYILPVVPPLAFLFADGFAAHGSSPRVRARWLTSIVISVVAGIAGVAWIATHPPHSARGPALTLATQLREGDQVLMLDHYVFDLPFYLQLRSPVAVVDRWDDPGIALQDNARKEIADAGRFAPARAAKTLVLPVALPALLCSAPTTWLVGPDDAAARYPLLTRAVAVSARDGIALWRVDARNKAFIEAAGCSGRPSAGSAGK